MRNLGSLKGKMTRKTPERVTLNSLDNLPNELLTEYGNVTIAIDLMYRNKIPFMIKSLQQIIDKYH